MKVKLFPAVRPLTLRDLKQGQLAIVLTGEFKGELMFKNCVGLHSISSDRYWPSDYANLNAKPGNQSWTGPLGEHCQLVESGDTIEFE